MQELCYDNLMKTDTNPTTYRKRPAGERGQAEHGWLHARFSFSFAEYFDPQHMNFHSLRVMNNDIVEPGGGFPTHPHQNAEIFTYVIEGELEHKDSMGNGSVIKAGDLQYMSAGKGVLHSEFNPSKDNRVELYQVWILPNENGGEPRYAEKPLGDMAVKNGLTLLFSPDGKEGSTAIRQAADIYFGQLDGGNKLEVATHASQPNVWVQVISGQVTVDGHTLGKADGLAIENQAEAIRIAASEDSKMLIFQLANQ